MGEKSFQHKQLHYPLVSIIVYTFLCLSFTVISCYLSLITAGVMVFLITCALVGIVALIVKHKMVATKNARGKTLLLSYIN